MFLMIILSIKTDLEDFFYPLWKAFSDAYDMLNHFLLGFMDQQTLTLFLAALFVLALILVLMAIINKNN